jgi:drug/metabolite transporter (DMT)-like permease
VNLRLRSRIERIGKRHWVTFPRCFLLTIGAAFIGIPSFVFMEQGEKRAEWPAWGFLLLSLLAITGLLFFTVGLLGDKKATERWARHSDSGAHPEVSILVAVCATPLFLFLKLFERDQAKKSRTSRHS